MQFQISVQQVVRLVPWGVRKSGFGNSAFDKAGQSVNRIIFYLDADPYPLQQAIAIRLQDRQVVHRRHADAGGVDDLEQVLLAVAGLLQFQCPAGMPDLAEQVTLLFSEGNFPARGDIQLLDIESTFKADINTEVKIITGDSGASRPGGIDFYQLSAGQVTFCFAVSSSDDWGDFPPT